MEGGECKPFRTDVDGLAIDPRSPIKHVGNSPATRSESTERSLYFSFIPPRVNTAGDIGYGAKRRERGVHASSGCQIVDVLRIVQLFGPQR